MVGAVAVAVAACRAAEEPAPPPTPELPEPVVIDGWPGPLRPHLEPNRDLTVRLHPQPLEAAGEAQCELPEDRLVQWTRSRLVIRNFGLLAVTTSTTVDAIRLPSLERVNGLSVQDSRSSPLELPKAQLTMMARAGGRCLIQPTGGETVYSLPCPTKTVQIAEPVQQSWWLELACSEGEGWFEVDADAFTIEHFPDELLREPRAPTEADRYRR